MDKLTSKQLYNIAMKVVDLVENQQYEIALENVEKIISQIPDSFRPDRCNVKSELLKYHKEHKAQGPI